MGSRLGAEVAGECLGQAALRGLGGGKGGRGGAAAEGGGGARHGNDTAPACHHLGADELSRSEQAERVDLPAAAKLLVSDRVVALEYAAARVVDQGVDLAHLRLDACDKLCELRCVRDIASVSYSTLADFFGQRLSFFGGASNAGDCESLLRPLLCHSSANSWANTKYNGYLYMLFKIEKKAKACKVCERGTKSKVEHTGITERNFCCVEITNTLYERAATFVALRKPESELYIII